MKQFYKIKLQQGQEIQGVTTIFSQNELKALQEQKLIDICQYNKKSFDSNEQVCLYVDLKDIPELTIKVF